MKSYQESNLYQGPQVVEVSTQLKNLMSLVDYSPLSKPRRAQMYHTGTVPPHNRRPRLITHNSGNWTEWSTWEEPETISSLSETVGKMVDHGSG